MAAIISLPESPDSLVLGGESEKEFVVYSYDANPSFEPVSGGQLCVTSSTTGRHRRDHDEPVTVPDVSDNDYLAVSCPDPRRPQPPTKINVMACIGVSCPNVAYQTGCENGLFCTGYAYGGGWRFDSFRLSGDLDPPARFRVKILGNEFGSAIWQVAFSGEAASSFIQLKYQWLELAVPNSASSIDLSPECQNAVT